MSGEGDDHEHPLIVFAQRYARAFHQDPVDVGRRDEADLPMMRLYYASAASDARSSDQGE